MTYEEYQAAITQRFIKQPDLARRFVALQLVTTMQEDHDWEQVHDMLWDGVVAVRSFTALQCINELLGPDFDPEDYDDGIAELDKFLVDHAIVVE